MSFMSHLIEKGLSTCKQVAKDLTSERELSSREKLRLKFHVFLCKDCQKYYAQLRKLGQFARSYTQKLDPRVEKIDRDVQNSLMEKIRNSQKNDESL